MFVLGFCLLWVETACGALSCFSAQATKAWALKSWQYFRDVMGSNSGDIILTRVNPLPPERLQVHLKIICICVGFCWCLWARVSVKNLEVHEKVGESFRSRGRIFEKMSDKFLNEFYWQFFRWNFRSSVHIWWRKKNLHKIHYRIRDAFGGWLRRFFPLTLVQLLGHTSNGQTAYAKSRQQWKALSLDGLRLFLSTGKFQPLWWNTLAANRITAPSFLSISSVLLAQIKVLCRSQSFEGEEIQKISKKSSSTEPSYSLTPRKWCLRISMTINFWKSYNFFLSDALLSFC